MSRHRSWRVSAQSAQPRSAARKYAAIAETSCGLFIGKYRLSLLSSGISRCHCIYTPPFQFRGKVLAEDLTPAQVAQFPNRLGIGHLDAIQRDTNLYRLGADRSAMTK